MACLCGRDPEHSAATRCRRCSTERQVNGADVVQNGRFGMEGDREGGPASRDQAKSVSRAYLQCHPLAWGTLQQIEYLRDSNRGQDSSNVLRDRELRNL